MPIIGKHHVHPYSNARALKDDCEGLPGKMRTVLLIQHLPHAGFRRISPQRFWFRGLRQKSGQRFAVCGGNPAWRIRPAIRGAAHWAKCETVHKNTKHWSAMMETRTCAVVQPKEDYHVRQIFPRICYCCGIGFADARCERQSGETGKRLRDPRSSRKTDHAASGLHEQCRPVPPVLRWEALHLR